MDTRSHTRGRIVAGLAAASSIALTAGVLVAGSPLHRAQYTATIAAPGSVTAAEDLPAPVSPLEIRAAVAAARGGLWDAVDGARASLPEVPWDEHGLSHVELAREWIRYDDTRELYVADLPDGRLAVLTLSPRIQRRVESILQRFAEPGEALVAIEPTTGRVVALVDDSSADAVGPGLALRAAAYAASTFKLVTSNALLEQGETTPSSETCFSGGGSGFSESDLELHPDTDTQCLSLVGAMAWSANLYFGRRADAFLTPDALRQSAEAVGFETWIPFELPVERSHLDIPSDRLGFARAAAGFSGTTMSPFHGALIQAAVANGGMMMVPTLVDRIEEPDGTVVYTHRPFAWRTPFTPERASTLREIQADTCVSGTARADFARRDGWPSSIQVWGKTGTLSNSLPDGTAVDPAYIYRWFTGFGGRGEDVLAVGGLVVNTAEWWIKGTYLGSEAILARYQ
ncbi:MAG: penicillin-binding protein [Myxococcales bacterium]|nr:penicillin-binding protein [Myxococcales bacterium]MCB9531110.1 penicillin-binding protein [Myxococcales bacterium]MCB9533020.1 penicillin-binding protein [Myxococcales bacterium]